MPILRAFLVRLLTWEAQMALKRHAPKVIAVTGSVGKTTTKDAIFAALSGTVHMRKSEKSFNSEIGVPLTILGLANPWSNPLLWIIALLKGAAVSLSSDYPKWLVLEVGADRPGDIRSIAKWLQPDIVVFTGVPEVPVHVEYFGSPEAVFKEKRSLAEYLKSGGKLILNADDMRAKDLKADFRSVAVTYGFSESSDYLASRDAIEYEDAKPVGMYVRVDHEGSSAPVSIRGALGRPRIYGALAALAVAGELGMDLVSATAALQAWTPPPGRMRIIEGVYGSTIIDDTYNSSPAAALAALDSLETISATGNKIAIMGDMLELGKFSTEAHRTLGERAARSANMLITVGFRARAMGEAALDNGLDDKDVREYKQDESLRAGKELAAEISSGDVVLVKGSQGMRMERTVFALMAHPEEAKDMLVRQDDEWLAR